MKDDGSVPGSAVATPRRAVVREALWGSAVKLDPRLQVRNPIIFSIFVASAMVTIRLLFELAGGRAVSFTVAVAVALWLTVLSANFAEAVAEGRGKAQADSLRRTRQDLLAYLVAEDGTTLEVPAAHLALGDVVLVEAGQLIPADGEVIEGIATVDESAITGESAPVIREPGGDRAHVTGGTKVLSDWIKVRVTSGPGQSFLDRMISLVEGSKRQKTPSEIYLTILLVAFTITALAVVMTLQPFAIYSGSRIQPAALIALFAALVPSTVGGLVLAIGIAGMNRLAERKVLALSGQVVEAAGDVTTLLLDKTGTITLGNREAVALHPAAGVDAQLLADVAQLASLADGTPEGRSIVVLTKRLHGLRGRELGQVRPVPFSADSRMSGVDVDGVRIRKGAVDAVAKWTGQQPDPGCTAEINRIAGGGGTPILVARDDVILGVVELRDVIKEDLPARFDDLRRMGVRTVMITGDNPRTAATVAKEAGVDDYLAQATPEDKLALIRSEQSKGRAVAMTGDGTNDAPALAAADVGVAMHAGSAAAIEAGNMVDLDSNPTKLIDIVRAGKQFLITRGALTTFSTATDVVKYAVILPVMFSGAHPVLGQLNIMGLRSPGSAILSAVVFNALVIVALLPLALHGVPYRAVGAQSLLRRNLLLYGVGGLVAPFFGIKLVDMILGFFQFP
ncbi:MAG: potassium-transporting ATPase subunit KdpB [Actinomycetota bacterium]